VVLQFRNFDDESQLKKENITGCLIWSRTCTDSLARHKRVSNIIRKYTDHMKFAAYMVFSFIIFCHVLLFPFFLSLYIWLCVLYGLFNFVNHVFLLLCVFCSVYSV